MLLALELGAAGLASSMKRDTMTTSANPEQSSRATVSATPASSNRGSSAGFGNLKRALFGALLLVLVAIAILVKLRFFPSLSEEYFALNERNLKQVSSGLVVVRPTRFAKSHFNGTVSTAVTVAGKPVPRIMGRNVSFKDLMAIAYGHSTASIALPADAPQTNFDFIVTARGNPNEKLQEAIRKKLGFVARVEPHEAEVIAVKVEDPNAPQLAVSEAGGKQNVEFHDGKLCFTHIQLSSLSASLEQVLGSPVVDKTALTNYFDFCVPWSVEAQRQLQSRATARPLVERILHDLGLALKPDTAPIPMLVVKRSD